MKKKFFKFGAKVMLVTLTYQLVFPACAYALTTGPSQPEVQSFEPVGTTEMVDMFTGDFNYNIPLMDVEGYPINIFYHSGVGVEQEASWVGLGWNINPGEINRTVRGLPDDFKGETIEKFTKIQEERDVRIGIGANVAAEIIGRKLDKWGVGGVEDAVKDLKDAGVGITLGGGFYIAHNNYRGLSAGITQSIGINTPIVSTGISFGIGSQTGADIDFNASASVSQKFKEGQNGTSWGVSAGVGSGFNSRSGLKDISLSVSPTSQIQKKNKEKEMKKERAPHNVGSELSTTIPIGMQNYVPVITNRVTQNSFALQLKAGGELWGGYASAYIDAMISKISYDENGSRAGYGYLYSEEANRESIRDFSRDKDVTFNETMQNLPLGANTYDVYSVNGQGTGGMFRPFRNDIGTFNDPYVEPGKGSDNFNGLIEAGFGNLFEIGGDLTTVRTRNECGPWVDLPYGKEKIGSLYEKVFFKHGGDLSYNQQQEARQLFGKYPQYLLPDLKTLVANGYEGRGSMPKTYNDATIFWDNYNLDRSSRTTHIAYRTADQIEKYQEAGFPNKIMSFEDGASGHFYDPKIVQYNRATNTLNKWVDDEGPNHNSQPHSISQFTQTQSDGRRYNYDIPAMNNATREVTFAIDETKANLANGYVGFTRGVDDGLANDRGLDHFYSTTNTPAYAHSYLLTSVLSNDYVDILGDGVTDDDLGSFTKFNYTLTDNDYRWRTPFQKDTAQYNPGFWSDSKDGKGNYMVGSRQQWYIRSIETKNYVAEFYTSVRNDGKGTQSSVLQANSKLNMNGLDLKSDKANASNSYKLDSIVLYNKHDRYINKDNAVPVKTVIMQYDYSLCKGTPNSEDANKGKLTLKRLFIKYGNSQKNLLSPYVFSYSSSNPNYDFSAKDRWGNYKAVKPGVHNYEFPYTDQPDNPAGIAQQNTDLSAWNLTDIKLPSGGKIHIDFESDDYAYVQDKRAMQMMKVEGLGSSKAYTPMNQLYIDRDNINDYVYFKRRILEERPGLSIKDNYLENQEVICYNFNLDLTGKGSYENIKAYAKIDEVGVCSNDANYGYVKLKRDDAKKLSLHPATIYGINTGRFYLPQIFYNGYQESTDFLKIIEGLWSAKKEMLDAIVGRNPFKRWIEEGKAKKININKSFLRMQTPSMAKKGGGIRVKQLTLSDNWNELSGNQDASYGKKYDYTLTDPDGRYGLISSGVASYEPMIGGEENPFHSPIPYAIDKGRSLPAAYFFQEEPFGESFFPGASVGYSSIKVSSIHQEYGRSAQALDEHLFYTAKEFPVSVSYTQIDGEKDKERKTLLSYTKETELTQGYSLVMNDMHGKPKAVNNYVIQQEGNSKTIKKITGTSYKYFTDANEKTLDNKVNALVRKRGSNNDYELRQVTLGQDIDIALDSRQRKTETHMTKTNLNLNTFMVGPFPILPFTVFHVQKDKTIGFKSLVTTKIIQQYGILKSVEQFDHEAITKTENLVFDAETGGVLLTCTNNQYKDNIYTRKDPAYLAYEGMKPTYTNMDYEEVAEKLVIDADRNGYLYTNHLERFSPGDELLAEIVDKKDVKFGANPYLKLWVLSNTGGKVCYPAKQTHNVAFWKPQNSFCDCSPYPSFGSITGSVSISIYATAAPATLVASGILNTTFNNSPASKYPSCADSSSYLSFNLPAGNYNFTASGTGILNPGGVLSGTFTILLNKGISIAMQNCYNHLSLPQTTKYCDKIIEPCIREAYTDSTSPCALLVAPRYKDKFATGTTSPNLSKWSTTAKTYKDVSIKIIRSGRRNNLNQMIQQTVFVDPLKRADFYNDINTYFGKSDNVITTSVNTFTDSAQNYGMFENTIDIPSASYAAVYGQFNPYVLGLQGNLRPLASYAPIAKRSYDKNHARFDGIYEIGLPFWIQPTCLSNCKEGRTMFISNNITASPFWKKASIVTRYDPNGNALEEQDALGNYSAAQYGYNRLLPVAVASNTRAQHIMFEGFEEYNMLMPQTASLLFKKKNIHSSFGTNFANLKWAITTEYPSEQASGDPAVFTRHNQRYYLMDKTPSGLGMELTKEASHTGNYSLKTTSSKSFEFEIKANEASLLWPFTLQPNTNYIVNFWAKSTTGAPIIPSMFTATVAPSSTSATISVKSGSIDGWYLVQANVDLGAISGTSLTATIAVPENLYIDDVRLMPSVANMKCFVYDPITFKLMAQLDENHFATFFEYDQEGLLIRTKKETSRGIMTISESRRSNSKLTP